MSATIEPEDNMMTSHLKNAAVTTAIVLATIWALRQVGATRSIVDKALMG